MVFELAGLRAFDSPVSRIVYPRREFVREQLAVFHKQFEGQHADIVEFRQEETRHICSLLFQTFC